MRVLIAKLEEKSKDVAVEALKIRHSVSTGLPNQNRAKSFLAAASNQYTSTILLGSYECSVI